MSVPSLALSRPREDSARSLSLRYPHRPGLRFGPAQASLFENGSDQVEWKVEVRPDPDRDLITRIVWRNGDWVNQCGSGRGLCAFDAFPEDPRGGHQRHAEVIWPTWPARSHDESAASPSPLAGVQQYWSTAGNRLRDSAKWSVAVLGAALATVIGTSPLAAIRDHRPQPIAVVLASAGLVLLGVTMFLVLQVMRPKSVSYDAVQNAGRRGWLPQTPLYNWHTTIESNQDLYLPLGINCLTTLRQSMIVEEVTLMALSCALASSDHASRDKLCQAQVARAARLRDLRSTAAMVATVGEYYTLRHRSSWATYGGILCGLLGAAAIITAFAWPLH